MELRLRELKEESGLQGSSVVLGLLRVRASHPKAQQPKLFAPRPPPRLQILESLGGGQTRASVGLKALQMTPVVIQVGEPRTLHCRVFISSLASGPQGASTWKLKHLEAAALNQLLGETAWGKKAEI